MQRLQATAGNAAVAAMLASRTGPETPVVQRADDCGGPGHCACDSCSTEDESTPGEDKAEPVVVSRAVEPAPPKQGEQVNLIGLTHNDGKDASGQQLRRGDKTKLRPTPSTNESLGVLGEFPVNTPVMVDRKIDTWYHVVVPSTGQTGYMAADLIETDLPDPKTTFHRVGPNEGAFEIIKNQYQVDPDDKFHNLRFYANGLVEVNSKRGRNGIYEPSSEEKVRLQGQAMGRGQGFIYVDAATRANAQIILPSKEFVETLDVSSGSWVRDVGHKAMAWLEKAAQFLAFPAGLIVGALECLWDTISGIVEMVWKLLKGIVTGSLLDDLREMADSMVKLFTDPQTRQAALEALADWLDARWNNPNAVKRWYWRGWIIGYLTAEVILTFFSGGEALAEAGAAQFAKLGKLIKATRFGSKAVAAIEGAVDAFKTSKVAVAVKDAADAAKGSKAVKAVKGAAKAVKESKVVRVVGGAVEKAASYAETALKFPKVLIARISDRALLALEKLSPDAAELLKRLSPDRLIKFLGCHSPCTISPENLAARLRMVEQQAAADAEAATAAAKKADRAAARAEAASKKAADEAADAASAAAKAKGKQAAAKAEEAKAAANRAKLASDKAGTARQVANDAKTAEAASASTLDAAKVRRAENLKRSAELGELRRYKVQEAADTLDDAGRAELSDLIGKLERGEITADDARKLRQNLIARAKAGRGAYKPAVLGPDQIHDVSKATGKKMDVIQEARQKLIDKRVAVDTKLEKLANDLGVDLDDIDAGVQKLIKQGKRAEAEQLKRLDAEYKQLGRQLVVKSEELGMVAVRDFASSRGARPLYEGPPGTPGTLDAAFVKTGRPTTLFVCEGKGGGSELGTRMIKGTAYQQGSPEYLRWMLENDKGFRAAVEEAGLLKLLETGEIKVEYHLVRAPGGQEVLINEFDITPRSRP
jgi:hypothetical protein